MTLSSTTIVVLVANGLSAVVAAAMLMLVLWQAPRARVNQLFALAMAMQLAYSVANGLGRFIDDLNMNVRDATYVAISFFGLYVTCVFFFASEFSENRSRLIRRMRWGSVIISILVLFALWTDRMISDIYPSGHNDGSFNADWTLLGLSVAGTIVLYLLVSTVVFYRMDNERGRAMWPGPFFLVLGNFSNFVLWPLFHLPLQSVFLAAAALFLGVPVLRHNLFNPRALLNQQLAEKNAELREAHRMKDQFLAKVSLELRTPLNSIIGYTELVLNGTYGALNDTQRDRLEKVVRNGRNLLGLINDVLDLNRIETGRVTLERTMLDTVALLDQVMDIIEPLAISKGLTVTRDYAGIIPIYADETRVRQIITNIAANAVKFTHEGGITVRASVVTDGVQFAIADSGIGISPEAYERVFAEFEQLDSSTTRVYEGTGLGMAITKRLVEMHEGRIWLESAVERGTTFYVTIPAREPTIADSDEALGAPHAATVLVIDDSAEARLLLHDILSAAGYRVVTANSGLAGLARAREIQPDLITLDVIMRGMDGWQVLRALKDDVRTRVIPVVIVSTVDNRPLAISLGASSAIAKPLDRGELFRVLRQTLLSEEAGAPILVVDDREDDRALVRDMLESQGYSVTCAASGREALAWLDMHDPGLVLLDLMMPDISGFEVLARMRQNERLLYTPVIVLTAKTLSDDERVYLESRATELVAKDSAGTDELLAIITRARQPV